MNQFLNFFWKNQILNRKIILKKSDIQLKITRFVRLSIKLFTTCQTLYLNFLFSSDFEKIFFLFSKVKFLPSPTTSTTHNLFLPTAMYKNSLQYLRLLVNRNRHRSNNTSSSRFRKDFPMVPTSFLCMDFVPVWTFYMQKDDASIKIIDNETRIDFVSHMCDWF